MTVEELQAVFRGFPMGKLPATYEVDAETYGRVCRAVLRNPVSEEFGGPGGDWRRACVWTGPNGGIIFRAVELILRGEK